MAEESKDQQHPLYNRDRTLIDKLLTSEVTDYYLAELARLRIRYQGFPGARDIQQDLDKIMQQWGFATEAELYEKTRAIHATVSVFKSRGNKGDEEDWN
jgi:regulator of sirC expression with transglutaminase-like and TPR domain